MSTAVPTPQWFADHRMRVIGVWVSLGVLGSSLVWASQWMTTGRIIFGLLAAGGAATMVVLLIGVHTGRHWPTRNGAGMAVMLHLSRLIALAWQILLPTEPHTLPALLGLVGTGAVVTVLLLQAGWLHWVANLPKNMS